MDMQDKLSECCHRAVTLNGDRLTGAMFYVCSLCHNPCDLIEFGTESKEVTQDGTAVMRGIEAGGLEDLLNKLPIAIVRENIVYVLKVYRDWFDEDLHWFVSYEAKSGGYIQRQSPELLNAVLRVIEEVLEAE